MEQAKSGEASHTSTIDDRTVEVAVELLRTCLRLLSEASPVVDESKDDSRLKWGFGSKRHIWHYQWLADQAAAVDVIKAILEEQ